MAATIIIVAGIAVLLVFAVRSLIKNSKKGGACAGCGGCGGCGSDHSDGHQCHCDDRSTIN